MAIVYGFAGLRLKEDGIFFSPFLPPQWKGYRFKITYEQSQITVQVKEEEWVFTLVSGEKKKIYVYGKSIFWKIHSG